MPEKLKKAMPIKAVIIIAMPRPRSGSGIFEYFNLSRIAANRTIAKKKPMPLPNEKTAVSEKLYSLSCIKRAQPSIEQLTVISGRKMPSALYSAGANFSTTISTNCTAPAMVEMNKMNAKNVKSTVAKDE